MHTQHTPANISVYIGVYIGMPAAVSGGVEECALDYTSPNIIYRHISVYVSVPAAVSGGYRSAHCPIQTLFRRCEGAIEALLRRIAALFRHDSGVYILYVFLYASMYFGGRLRHRLVAPVFHGSATLTRPMLQPHLNISQYISIHTCI